MTRSAEPGLVVDPIPIPIAVAALVRDGHVLLAHRHPQRRWYPDCWDLVGGHVEAGERPREAVVRECREELGVVVGDPTPVPLAIDDPTLVVHAFVVTRWDGGIVNAAPEEHDDLRWVSPAGLSGLTLAHPGVAGLVRDVAARLSREPRGRPAGADRRR